jgi:hypothetical protein
MRHIKRFKKLKSKAIFPRNKRKRVSNGKEHWGRGVTASGLESFTGEVHFDS